MCNLKNNPENAPAVFAEDNKSVTEGLDIVTGRVVKYIITSGVTLSTAESCTGGMIAERITSIPGASGIFAGGVVSYSEDVKVNVLGVKRETLDKHTVYSAETASEMSRGVMDLMKTEAAIAVTGLAGPSGGTAERPVGTVFVSVRHKNREEVRDLRLYEEYESLDRELIRLLTVRRALEMLEGLLVSESEGE
ncbi:nicotinamide-nucleotide amidase [Ruminococcaceae bacterium FB2012]|nr:nicotinamide-nucleotide amidase [Ruminococcaceae bacterium FB2012]